MIKTLGQNGLNFIANKYKELKSLLNTKADNSEIKTKLSELIGDSTHRTVTDAEKSNWDNKVDKITGKGLSANDYDNTAKTKVDAIPINPKYTDTVTEVVDNLTTDDGTKALSARQGKVLQDNKADKSDISKCKTKGYGTVIPWMAANSTRNLEDWIGDFDGRTRELKENSNIKYTQSKNERGITNTWTNTWAKIRIGKCMILIGTSGSDLKTLLSKLFFEEDERPKHDNYYAVATFTNSGVYGIGLFSLRANGDVSQDMIQPKEYVSGSLVLAYELA